MDIFWGRDFIGRGDFLEQDLMKNILCTRRTRQGLTKFVIFYPVESLRRDLFIERKVFCYCQDDQEDGVRWDN